MSTASNFVALYSNACISKVCSSVSAICNTLNNLASVLVFPVARADLEIIHIDSAAGALASIALLSPPVSIVILLGSALSLSSTHLVSVLVNGVHWTKT